MTRSVRTLYVEALETLIRGDVARVMAARDWELLREVAHLAQEDAPHDLAFTDPALFRTWREAVTKFHLAGYSSMTPQRVDEVTGPRIAAE